MCVYFPHKYKVSGTFEKSKEKSNLNTKSQRNVQECKTYLVLG